MSFQFPFLKNVIHRFDITNSFLVRWCHPITRTNINKQLIMVTIIRMMEFPLKYLQYFQTNFILFKIFKMQKMLKRSTLFAWIIFRLWVFSKSTLLVGLLFHISQTWFKEPKNLSINCFRFCDLWSKAKTVTDIEITQSLSNSK